MKRTALAFCLIIIVAWMYFYFRYRKTDGTDLLSKLNKTLVRELGSIRELDQKYRVKFDSMTRTFDEKAPEMQAFLRTVIEADSVNLTKVKMILDEKGWPGPEIIGPEGSTTLFLVIQHSDLKTQEKYLPAMRKAVAEGKAEASDLALLEDRILIGQGKRQTYGSQIGLNKKTSNYYILPLEDPDGVDKRRAAMGLGPLAEYVTNWDIRWDPKQYKKNLPAIEAMHKNVDTIKH